MENVDSKAREHAENLVGYFERIANENDGEVWQKGLVTAQEWLRLISEENAPQVELLTFIGVVHANRYRGSGWFDLALGAYHWVRAKGVSVPPAEVFFASEGLPSNISFFRKTFHEQAYALLAIFEEYNEEDPSSEVWASGIEIIHDWLKLIDMPNVKKPEISVFVQSMFHNQNKFLSTKVWFDTALGVSFWCKEKGYLDLVPDRYQSLVALDEQSEGI